MLSGHYPKGHPNYVPTLQERQAATVMDVVSADEIGTLPDQNVAEAVQRVPGVFMETSRGEGRTVSIRGVAPNLNNVTLNGQPLASTATDRATALDLLPASMVSSIEVIKAVTPDMDANTIGGTVNLRNGCIATFNSYGTAVSRTPRCTPRMVSARARPGMPVAEFSHCRFIVSVFISPLS